MDDKKRNRYQRVIFLGITIMSVAGIILVTLIWKYWNDARKAKDYVAEYTRINTQRIENEVDHEKESIVLDNTEISPPVPVIPWYRQITVNLAGAEQNNSNIVGWIYIENEDISYPILFSGDNEKYLKTGVDEKYSYPGAIFLDGRNSTDFEDSRSIIYGHNMQNLSMFGKLKYYVSDESYYSEHFYIQIFSGTNVYRYQIFAYSIESPEENIDQVSFDSTTQFLEYVNEIRRQSYIKTDVPVSEEDKVITLYTCSANDNKLLIHAVRVDSHSFI